MELEIQRGRDVGVGELLHGQANVEADGFAVGVARAAVGGFHDAGSTACGNDEAVPSRRDLRGPLGQHFGELARIFVIARAIDGC